MHNNHVTILEIDANALAFNLQFFKSKLKSKTKVLVVVKAFGYGSDAVKIASFLSDKVDYFAVAYTDEGISLRAAGIKTPILVLHPQIQNFELLIQYNLEPNLYSFNTLVAFNSLLEKLDIQHYLIHLKINSGLNRLGFKEARIPILITELKKYKRLTIKSIFSHIAASEDLEERAFTLKQISVFNNIAAQISEGLNINPDKHMLNTSGIINYSKEAQFDMVRFGIGLFGFGNDKNVTAQLQNALTLKSVISQIQVIEKGESIGYNRGLIADKTMRTATIPIGHADGIGRTLGNGGTFVTINSQKASIVGNVCMDMIMVDVTDIDCKEGGAVIIFDSQEKVEQMAKTSHTIAYEMLTAISQRIKRVLTF
ncbi:MAG: alanine racemase [Flavobacteriaceae bacterium]|nr:MAG: alanine racemase [Flavobacteriaceae bacterium]